MGVPCLAGRRAAAAARSEVACADPSHPRLPPTPAEFLPLPRMNELERENFEAMKAELRDSIQKGVDFMARTG